jgi:N-ethylmaleimide reductase
VDLLEALPGTMMYVAGEQVAPHFRKIYKGKLVLNGGYFKAESQAALASGSADAIAIGIPFIANPDLITRLKTDAPLATAPMSSWYMGGDEGYNEYPALAA